MQRRSRSLAREGTPTEFVFSLNLGLLYKERIFSPRSRKTRNPYSVGTPNMKLSGESTEFVRFKHGLHVKTTRFLAIRLFKALLLLLSSSSRGVFSSGSTEWWSLFGIFFKVNRKRDCHKPFFFTETEGRLGNLNKTRRHTFMKKLSRTI